jgi:hypothetical protein
MTSALSRTLKTQRVQVHDGFWVHVDPINWEGSKTTKSHTFYDKKFFQLFCEPLSRDIKYKTNYISRYYKSLHAKITKPKRGGRKKRRRRGNRKVKISYTLISGATYTI